MSLANRYRPRTFEDFVGSNNGVESLKALLRQGLPTPALLSGHPGTGKTTLALVCAQSLNCERPTASGSPCLACETCRAFDTDDAALFFSVVNAGKLDGSVVAEHVNEMVRRPPLGVGRARVTFVDEVQALRKGDADRVLEAFEFPGSTAFIAATSELWNVAPALRSRCIHIKTELIPRAGLIGLGRKICGIERFAFEPEALAMLAGAAQGEARAFVMNLDTASARGAVTVAAVAQSLDLCWTNVALVAGAKLLRGELAGALDSLSRWEADASTKAGALRDAFAFVAQRFWSPNPDADALNTAFLAASAAAIDDLGAAVAQRAVVLGMPAMVCANEWALDWSRSIAEVRDPIDLSLHVYRFAHKVSPPEAALAPLPPPTVPPVSPAQPRRRAAMSTTARKRGATVKARGDSITKVDVRAEYRAATMLPQAYGVWFNARLVLRYADYRVTDWTAAAKLLSGLTHELGMRLRDRTGDAGFRLHWLCQHEADEGGLRTWLLMHIPGDEVRCAREWIVEHLPEPEGFPYKVLGEDVWRAPAVLGRPHELHWSLVRELWRPLSLDIEERDKSGRRSLRDLLQVPPQAPRVAGTLPAGFRRYSSSKTLGTGQWKAACADGMGFVSAFDAAAFDTRAWLAVDAGWERDELAYRRVEIARRQTEIDALRALFPADMSPVDEAQFQQRLAALEASWELDPIRRPRPKPLW